MYLNLMEKMGVGFAGSFAAFAGGMGVSTHQRFNADVNTCVADLMQETVTDTEGIVRKIKNAQKLAEQLRTEGHKKQFAQYVYDPAYLLSKSARKLVVTFMEQFGNYYMFDDLQELQKKALPIIYEHCYEKLQVQYEEGKRTILLCAIAAMTILALSFSPRMINRMKQVISATPKKIVRPQRKTVPVPSISQIMAQQQFKIKRVIELSS